MSEYTCTECNRIFVKPISLSNHRRWHKLPQYIEFQDSCRGKMSKLLIGNKYGIKNTGLNNGMWKGVNAGLGAIHTHIKSLLPKTALCQDCNSVPPYDLANISQEYKRDIQDWEWLCRRCHMIKDGRMGNLKQYSGVNIN